MPAGSDPTGDPQRFAGTAVPVPEFGGDDGAAAPELTAALAAYSAGDAGADAVLATLAPARLLVPVVAVLDSVEDAGAAVGAEKDSHLATVTLQNSDGRSGLLAFTGTDALRAWRADARPVPAAAARVAAAALQEGADAVLLDVAGPVPFAVDRPVLLALAAGRLPLPAHRDPEVATAVAGVLTAVAGGMEGARLGDGSGHRADLELALPAGLDQAVLEQIATAVAADPVLARRCPRGVALVVG